MKSLDFMYDGQYLSDYGFSIGYVTTSGRSVTVSPGAEIEFEKISRNRGRDYSLVSANYSGSYTTTFEIFKNPEIYGDALDCLAHHTVFNFRGFSKSLIDNLHCSRPLYQDRNIRI